MQEKDQTTHAMQILTNRYQDCELLNLSTNKNGHGPYLSARIAFHLAAEPRKKIAF